MGKSKEDLDRNLARRKTIKGADVKDLVKK